MPIAPSPSSPTSPASGSTGAAPQPPQQHIGGLTRTLKSLFALSHRAAQAMSNYFHDPEWAMTYECDWRVRRMLTGGYWVEATIDSGAAASVCPPSTFPEYEQLPAEDQYFVAANGDLVPELHRVRPVIVTREGLLRQTQFSVANVNKVLVSAAQICNRGHRVVLDNRRGHSFIEDADTGEQMMLDQKDGVYVQQFAVVRPRNVGFRGPAPFMIPTQL